MGVWGFWAVVAAVVLLVSAILARAMARAKADVRASADYDLAVYRDQLVEIERDIARGVIAADEGTRLRTEVSRRLLEADRAARAAAPQVRGSAGWGMAALVGVVLIGSVALYWDLGAPGYPDLPLKQRLAMSEELRETRPSQAEAEGNTPLPTPRADVEPAFAELMEKLRAAVIARPDDLRGLELLARNEAAIGNISAARNAQEAVIRVKGDTATAEDHAALAELMIMAAGGYISPEAETVLAQTLQIDPENGTARYYSGVMFAQVGRFDRTFVLWKRLLEQSPPEAPWVAPIREQIEEAAMRAGIDYTLPEAKGAAVAGAPGPTAEDMENAADMTPQERQAMIEGMVDRLGERLANEGGTAEEWARLISALANLGRTDQARAIYAEAQTRFAGRSVDLAGIKEAAVSAGVAE